jgi:hypothetical protein
MIVAKFGRGRNQTPLIMEKYVFLVLNYVTKI